MAKIKKLALVFAVTTILLTSVSEAQPPAYIWARTLPGNVESIQRTILTDQSGNIFISGVFFGTVDFDPSGGMATITPSPYGCNIYIAKYDANGNYLWAKNIPIAASYGGSSMALDGSGNIYLTGFFSGTGMDFDPGPGSALLNSSGSNDVYIAKYDNNGNFLWSMSLGAAGDDRGNEVVTDAGGNVIVTGCFSQVVDFDPSVAVANLSSMGDVDIFVASYSPGGLLQWVRQLGGAGVNDTHDIEIDNSGNIFLTGLFSGTADFDPGSGIMNLTSWGSNDVFLARYDASGNFVWANNFGAANSDAGSALDTDPAGNIFISGIFSGTVDFDPGGGIANLSAASSATFFCKYDSNGNFIWGKQLPMNFNNSDIVLTAQGNLFVSGYYGWGYGSPIDMDPGSGVANLIVPTNLPPPTYNILGFYDGLGNYLWAGVFGRQCYCSVMGYKSSLFIDASGYLYYAGIFNGPWGSGTVDFDPGSGVANLVAPSLPDNVFFAKYLINNNPLPVTLVDFHGTAKDNAHILEWITASEINNNYFIIEKSTNGFEFQNIGQVNGSGSSSQQHRYNFTDNYPANGNNYYRLKQFDFDEKFSYSNTIRIMHTGADQTTLKYSGNGVFYLQTSLPFHEKFAIFDYSGRLIKNDFLLPGEELKIDLSGYSQGIYCLQIHNGVNYTSYKLVYY